MEMLSDILKQCWRTWQSMIHQINDVIAWFLMSATYILAVTPVACFFKLFVSDPLDRQLGDPQQKSYWKSIPDNPESRDIRKVQRQY